ncbi:MAG: hypothetical protein CMP47_02915 [Rickettsiales bacterium]|nr:hypothetical protein [Rickettsiales bacterium]
MDEILRQVTELATINVGLMNIFILHTSASLTINENADSTVRTDFESFFNRTVPENEPYYQHTFDGSDDLPAHLKSSILGSNLTISITSGNLGQGIYLCEHRNLVDGRRLIVTIQGEAYKS